MFDTMFKRLSKVILTFTLVAYTLMGFSVGTAYADVNSNMDDFFDNSLASSTATGPQAFQGQQYGYYTFGSLSYRAPQSDVALGSIRLPSVKAGCGGIDIFAGGFSFINSDELVAVLKNMASNAVGLLFQMAVDSLSEILGTNIKDFMSKLQAATNRNINSCEAAQKVIAGIVKQTVSASMNACMENGINNGKYSDYSEAFAKCGAGGEAESMAAAGTDSQKAAQNVDRNIAWEALMKHPIFKNDIQLSETMMTLTGTYAIAYSNNVPDSNGNTGPQLDVKPPSAMSDQVIATLLDGGKLNVWDCGSDTAKCLHIAGNQIPVTITASSALRPKVEQMLTDIVNAIKNRTALTDDQKAFVASAPIPIYRMASVAVAKSPLTASSELSKYSDYLATIIVINWIKENTYQVMQASSNLVGLSPEQKGQWDDGVRGLLSSLDTREQSVTQKLQAAETVLRNYQAIETEIYGDASSRLSQSLLFVNSMKNAG